MATPAPTVRVSFYNATDDNAREETVRKRAAVMDTLQRCRVGDGSLAHGSVVVCIFAERQRAEALMDAWAQLPAWQDGCVAACVAFDADDDGACLSDDADGDRLTWSDVSECARHITVTTGVVFLAFADSSSSKYRHDVPASVLMCDTTALVSERGGGGSGTPQYRRVRSPIAHGDERVFVTEWYYDENTGSLEGCGMSNHRPVSDGMHTRDACTVPRGMRANTRVVFDVAAPLYVRCRNVDLLRSMLLPFGAGVKVRRARGISLGGSDDGSVLDRLVRADAWTAAPDEWSWVAIECGRSFVRACDIYKYLWNVAMATGFLQNFVQLFADWSIELCVICLKLENGADAKTVGVYDRWESPLSLHDPWSPPEFALSYAQMLRRRTVSLRVESEGNVITRCTVHAQGYTARHFYAATRVPSTAAAERDTIEGCLRYLSRLYRRNDHVVVCDDDDGIATLFVRATWLNVHDALLGMFSNLMGGEGGGVGARRAVPVRNIDEIDDVVRMAAECWLPPAKCSRITPGRLAFCFMLAASVRCAECMLSPPRDTALETFSTARQCSVVYTNDYATYPGGYVACVAAGHFKNVTEFDICSCYPTAVEYANWQTLLELPPPGSDGADAIARIRASTETHADDEDDVAALDVVEEFGFLRATGPARDTVMARVVEHALALRKAHGGRMKRVNAAMCGELGRATARTRSGSCVSVQTVKYATALVRERVQALAKHVPVVVPHARVIAIQTDAVFVALGAEEPNGVAMLRELCARDEVFTWKDTTWDACVCGGANRYVFVAPADNVTALHKKKIVVKGLAYAEDSRVVESAVVFLRRVLALHDDGVNWTDDAIAAAITVCVDALYKTVGTDALRMARRWRSNDYRHVENGGAAIVWDTRDGLITSHASHEACSREKWDAVAFIGIDNVTFLYSFLVAMQARCVSLHRFKAMWYEACCNARWSCALMSNTALDEGRKLSERVAVDGRC